MFANNDDTYFSFVGSFYGVVIIVIAITGVKSLDHYFKEKLYSQHLSLSINQIWKEILFAKNSKFNRQILNTFKNRADFSLKEYSCRLYYYAKIAASDNKRTPYSCSQKDLKNDGLDYSLGLFLILVTSLLFVHDTISNNVQEISFMGIEMGSFGFKDVGTLIYHISQKFVVCIFMVVWFITSDFWWRWAILSPIIFYSYQFWESFQPVYEIDGAGNMSVFPLVFLTILGVLLLSRIIRRISINLDYKTILEEELDKSIGELSKLEGGV